MGTPRYRSVLLNLLLFYRGSYADVPASNSIQTSILSEQAYNLCLYEQSIGSSSSSCVPFGTATATPSQTVVSTTLGQQPTDATFYASFFSEYGGLPCPGTTITTSDASGASATVPVGELGQGLNALLTFDECY